MPYTLAEAAKATGTNKTPILRAIKSARITGTKNDLGAVAETRQRAILAERELSNLKAMLDELRTNRDA